MSRRVAACLVLLALCGCARTSATTWGYSSWYRRGSPGAGDMGAFEAQRNTCLSELQLPEPEAVQADSREERQFAQCMRSAGWCTQMWGCDGPLTY